VGGSKGMNKKISAIIRHIDMNPETLKSIPKDENIEVIVSDWRPPDSGEPHASKKMDGCAVARNDGAAKAAGDVFVFLDGDIEFNTEFFYYAISLCKPGVVVGLENKWQHFIIGRYIVIMRDDFIRAGGVDPHMFYHEDMSFSYKLENMGYQLVKLDEGCVRCLGETSTDRCKKMKRTRFATFLRIQMVLAFKYPNKHFFRVPRNIFDFWYHRYLAWRGKL
jgi:glycosyltransferase involved in cell wall biosynthesis